MEDMSNKQESQEALTDRLAARLRGLRKTFQAMLDAVNQQYYNADGTPVLPQTGNPNYHSDTDAAMQHLNRFGFPKLRPGGFIAGDDYDRRGIWDHGVTRAVDEFIATGAAEVVRLHNHQFLLRKR